VRQPSYVLDPGNSSCQLLLVALDTLRPSWTRCSKHVLRTDVLKSKASSLTTKLPPSPILAEQTILYIISNSASRK